MAAIAGDDARVCGGLVGVGVAGTSVGVGWEAAGATVVLAGSGDSPPPQATITASAAKMPSNNDATFSTRTSLLLNHNPMANGHCAALSFALS